MSKDSKLTFFSLESGEVITFYNGKQITLGLLVKGNFKDKVEQTTDFEVIKPVIIHSDIFFDITKDALTGEYYNVFGYECVNAEKVLTKTPKVSRNLGKCFFGTSDQYGVIDYRLYYYDDIKKEIEERLNIKYADLTPGECAAASDGIIFDKIKNIFQSQEQFMRTNKKEDV